MVASVTFNEKTMVIYVSRILKKSMEFLLDYQTLSYFNYNTN